MGKYRVEFKSLGDASYTTLYKLTSNENGSNRYFKTTDQNELGKELSEAEFDAEIASNEVINEFVKESQNTGRLKHFYTDTEYDIEVVSSGLSDHPSTTLYYVLDKGTGKQIFFKTNDEYPEGVYITYSEGIDLATTGGLTGILQESKNEILKRFPEILSANL